MCGMVLGAAGQINRGQQRTDLNWVDPNGFRNTYRGVACDLTPSVACASVRVLGKKAAGAGTWKSAPRLFCLRGESKSSPSPCAMAVATRTAASLAVAKLPRPCCRPVFSDLIMAWNGRFLLLDGP